MTIQRPFTLTFGMVLIVVSAYLAHDGNPLCYGFAALGIFSVLMASNLPYGRSSKPVPVKDPALVDGSCWWSHKWTKWEVVQRGNIKFQNGAVIGLCTIQRRYCVCCGFEESHCDSIFS